MKSKPIFVACGLAMSLTGCLHPTIGPKSLAPDRAAYSAGLAESWKEQMLLNIVKIRYLDPPTFVDIGNIVMSYGLAQTANASGAIPVGANGSASLGISGSFSTTPTITYTPLTGGKFIQGLLTPVPPTAVFSAIQNGTPADWMMLAALFSINGLKNEQATLEGITPADPDFDKVRVLVRKIQLSGGVRSFVREESDNRKAIAVVAFRNADVSSETLANIKELRSLLKLNPDATEFTLAYAPVASNDTEIAVLPRSIIGLMQNMAADVEVPAEDLAKHRAFVGFEKDRVVPDTPRLVRIHSDKTKPADAFVAVKYEGNWFWIDKGDLHSKGVFMQLMVLFTIADTAPREPPPVLTIPTR